MGEIKFFQASKGRTGHAHSWPSGLQTPPAFQATWHSLRFTFGFWPQLELYPTLWPWPRDLFILNLCFSPPVPAWGRRAQTVYLGPSHKYTSAQGSDFGFVSLGLYIGLLNSNLLGRITTFIKHLLRAGVSIYPLYLSFHFILTITFWSGGPCLYLTEEKKRGFKRPKEVPKRFQTTCLMLMAIFGPTYLKLKSISFPYSRVVQASWLGGPVPRKNVSMDLRVI